MGTCRHKLFTGMILTGIIVSGCSSGKVKTEKNPKENNLCAEGRTDNRLDCKVSQDDALHAQNLADFSILLEDEYTNVKNLKIPWAKLAGDYKYTYLQATGPDCSTAAPGFTPVSDLIVTEMEASLDDDGDYFICLSASAPRFDSFAAKNNGFKLTLDTIAPAAPVVEGLVATTNPLPEWTWSTADTSGNGRYRANLNSDVFAEDSPEAENTIYQAPAPFPDGTYRLFVQARDKAGNWSPSGSFETIVDTTPPTVVLSEVFPLDAPNFLHVQIDFSEKVLGFELADIVIQNATAINLTGDGPVYNLVLQATSPNITVRIPADIAADIVALNNLASEELAMTFDLTAPDSPGILIAGGTLTKNADVTLSLQVNDGVEMYITNTVGCTDNGNWEAFAPTKSDWILGQTDGTATVYVKYRDDVWNESTCASDTIIHDGTKPVLPLANISSQIFITPFNVILSEGTPVDINFSSIQYKLDGTAPASCTDGMTYSAAININGTASVTLKAVACDLAGNLSEPLTAQYDYNATPPSITAISDLTIGTSATDSGSIAFTVNDAESPLASLTLSGSSNNTALIPNANIVISGTNGSRTVVVTPVTNGSGSANITITVDDGDFSTSESFNITVERNFVWNGTGDADSLGKWLVNGTSPVNFPGNQDTVILDATSTGNMNWNVNTVLKQWIQQATYSGVVTVGTSYTGVLLILTVNSNVTIAGGSWNHADNSSTQTNRLKAQIGGDLILTGTATINASGSGYDADLGPGGNNIDGSKFGGSYGGIGGNNSEAYIHAGTYGNIKVPVDLGSGGDNASGGGAVYLTVAGTTSIAAGATISANGASSPANGCGSGGSLYLETQALSGSGIISADGGTCNADSAGGSGGRVAVVLTGAAASFTGYTGQIRAWGGKDNTSDQTYARLKDGAAGTVYKQTGAQYNGSLPGSLTVANNSTSKTSGNKVTLLPDGDNLNTLFSSVQITGTGILGIDNDNTVDLGTLNLSGNGGLAILGDALTTFPATWTITGYTIYGNGITKTLNNLTIASGGTLTHAPNGAAIISKLILNISGALNVNNGGKILADGAGFEINTGAGAGTGTNDGGGHGGLGADHGKLQAGITSNTYGSILNPDTYGSGGNHSAGGGILRLTVAGITTVAGGGSITATGQNGAEGTGAGGSIYLQTFSLAGAGTISANGGNSAPFRAAGGGGRVAVLLTDAGSNFSTFLASGTITAAGGDESASTGYDGAPGSVYLQTGAQAAGYGAIDINNLIRSNHAGTENHLPPATGAFTDNLANATINFKGNSLARLTAIRTVKDIFIEAAATIDLGPFDLTTGVSSHALSGTVNASGGSIIWQ